jgi:16S rRNA (cytidine1402-2'-O)-methyltransferase
VVSSQPLGTVGRLEVVATPIGNLGDLTPRARAALAAADLIAAEDTRRTAALLRALGLAGKLISLHGHNEVTRVAPLLRELQRGKVIALVCDAGTPLLSDPGLGLVRAAVAAGIEVRALPGASALTAALSIAGLPTGRFAFEGFLPARASERRAALARLAREPRTLVFFEAPHRLAALLADMSRLFGEQRRAAVARELTKVHETVHRGTLGELAAQARCEPNLVRGEITLLVDGAPAEAHGSADPALLLRTLRALLDALPPGRAAGLAAQIAGVPRSEAYALARRLRAPDEVERGS